MKHKTKYNFIKSKGSKCSKCNIVGPIGGNTPEGLTVHHIKKVVNGGTNNKQNLSVLCNQCHRTWHKIEKMLDLSENDYLKWVGGGKYGDLLDKFEEKIGQIENTFNKRYHERIRKSNYSVRKCYRKVRIKNFILEWKNCILENR